MPYCPSCGKKIGDTDNYCLKCGKPTSPQTSSVQLGPKEESGHALGKFIEGGANRFIESKTRAKRIGKKLFGNL